MRLPWVTRRDGTEHLSEAVEVAVTMAEAVRLSAPWPNPAAERAQVELAVREAQHVRVVLPVDRQASVLYVLRVEGERVRAPRTFTVVR